LTKQKELEKLIRLVPDLERLGKRGDEKIGNERVWVPAKKDVQLGEYEVKLKRRREKRKLRLAEKRDGRVAPCCGPEKKEKRRRDIGLEPDKRS